jgi:hypothetical protein
MCIYSYIYIYIYIYIYLIRLSSGRAAFHAESGFFIQASRDILPGSELICSCAAQACTALFAAPVLVSKVRLAEKVRLHMSGQHELVELTWIND